MEQIHYIEAAAGRVQQEFQSLAGQMVSLHGAVSKIRKMSGFAFVLLRTAERTEQCVWEEGVSGFPLELLCEEACVEAEAVVRAEPRAKAGYELCLKSVRVLSAPAQELPFAVGNKEINTSFEKMLDYRPLVLRSEKERAIFRLQACLCRAFREYLEQQGFTEAHTPKLVSEGAEGGANIFRLDYFGRQAYLAQSPQFYKQILTGVFERVYEIGPVFRAEKHDTSRHLNEYTGVDFEMGYISGFEEIMEMETGMLRFAMEYLEQHAGRELALRNVRLPEVGRIPAVRFHEAKELIAAKYHREIADYEDFEPEEERLLGELIRRETGSEFVFVTHYPSSKRPFYAMETPGNPEVTESFDLLFRGLEVTTGGQRIHDYAQQVEKMKRRGMDPESFGSYLMLHKYGAPPHGGLGLGLERFTARLLELENVRQAALFPRDIHRLTP
ncbi:MAG: aspartate--tRNA(Asn) ligase [Lachnospiraceae bacterium]|nr:aspartate--tRNA(Asn) ligase [Lachnospiraceae bacterium]